MRKYAVTLRKNFGKIFLESMVDTNTIYHPIFVQNTRKMVENEFLQNHFFM
eukprot:TRINITY_DN6629_c0_g1_i1.p2 TRINITY_DN6629_c0_g1~~TRINITY_DN6629_c0_g1_i1.p2  ORF type:complete len:51 (-),score=5.46 TRINITY_DN6629_c0_g1_i1:87-239(-)